MALQFQAPFQINPYAETPKQRSLAALNQTISGIGNDALQYSQQQKQNKIQQAMLDLQKAKDTREQRESDFEYGPAGYEDPTTQQSVPGAPPSQSMASRPGTAAPMPSGSLQLGTTGPQPNYSLASGQDAYAPSDGSTPMPIDHASHFMNWKSMGMPQTYDHPDYGGTGQAMGAARPNPLGNFDMNSIMTLPGSKRRAEAMSLFKDQGTARLQESEINKNNATASFYKNYKGPALDASIGTKEEQHQDKLEEDYRKALQGVRGDPSIARAELQRDAAIIAYNRISEIERTGKPMNPIDYVDILGQVYKARTGSAPTNEVLETARQKTAQGKMGEVYTYFTGNQAPATSQDIQNSLKDMAASMGAQADKLHEGYMNARIKPPTSLSSDRASRVKSERGMSFAEATGYQPPRGGEQNFSQTATDSSGRKVGWNGRQWVPIQ